MAPPGVSQSQISALEQRIEKGFDELKEMLKGFDERVRAVEQREAGCQPIITARLDAAFRKIDDHDLRLITVEKHADRMMAAYQFMLFMGSALGLSVIALIWALITGQAQVVFK